MEGNKLTHNMPTWNSRKLVASKNPSSLSLEPNEKLVRMNNTHDCKSPKTKDKDDKARDPEEGHNENDKVEIEARVEETGREKLKRFREEVTEKVDIPENWGQEELLKDWIDCTVFDALFVPHRLIVTARDALVANGRKSGSQRLRI